MGIYLHDHSGCCCFICERPKDPLNKDKEVNKSIHRLTMVHLPVPVPHAFVLLAFVPVTPCESEALL